jgi:aminoglycoside phosphotransferase (APT) family kinase protein
VRGSAAGESAIPESRTRVRLEPRQVDGLVRAALGSDARVAHAKPLGGGTFNACWSVALADGRALVLKVAPPPDLPLLGYEQELLRTEVDFYARAARAGVPVPSVVGADFARRAIASDYFLMTSIAGLPLAQARRRISRQALRGLRAELGGVVARLADVRGEFFGYAPPAVKTRAPTWRAAFGAMLARILEDAERLGVALPRPAPELAALAAACGPALDQVATPRLVHFDLWDGNVLVDLSGDRPRLAALIDGERAFWGDPLAELASLALFGEIERDADFLRGYAEASGRELAFAPAERQRILLAQLYLYLLMRVEPATRGSGGLLGFAIQRLVSRSLRRVLRRLDAELGRGR